MLQGAPVPVPLELFGLGFCRVLLDAEIALEAEGQIADGVGVEFVALVAVGVGVLAGEIEEVGVAEGERIALVGVGVLVDGVGVLRLEHVVMRHGLSHAERDAAIEALGGAGGVGDCTEVGEGRGAAVRHRVGVARGWPACWGRLIPGSATGPATLGLRKVVR